MSAGRRLAAFALALATAAAGGDPRQSTALLERLHGEWRGVGEVRRMAADMQMRWEPVLDGQFHRLSMENRMTGPDGKAWHFKATGYYRVGDDGAIAGTWFDSRGVSLPLTGRVEGDALVVDWGTAEIERGRSTYRLAGDSLEVTDEVYGKDGHLAVFGRTRLTRN